MKRVFGLALLCLLLACAPKAEPAPVSEASKEPAVAVTASPAPIAAPEQAEPPQEPVEERDSSDTPKPEHGPTAKPTEAPEPVALLSGEDEYDFYVELVDPSWNVRKTEAGFCFTDEAGSEILLRSYNADPAALNKAVTQRLTDYREKLRLRYGERCSVGDHRSFRFRTYRGTQLTVSAQTDAENLLCDGVAWTTDSRVYFAELTAPRERYNDAWHILYRILTSFAPAADADPTRNPVELALIATSPAEEFDLTVTLASTDWNMRHAGGRLVFARIATGGVTDDRITLYSCLAAEPEDAQRERILTFLEQTVPDALTESFGEAYHRGEVLADEVPQSRLAYRTAFTIDTEQGALYGAYVLWSTEARIYVLAMTAGEDGLSEVQKNFDSIAATFRRAES